VSITGRQLVPEGDDDAGLALLELDGPCAELDGHHHLSGWIGLPPGPDGLHPARQIPTWTDVGAIYYSIKSGQGRQNLTRMFFRRCPPDVMRAQPSSKKPEPGMSMLTGSVYGWLPKQTEQRMKMDRRSFLARGLAYASLPALPGTYPIADFVAVNDTPDYSLHPFTRSLLGRLVSAGNLVDGPEVERVIRQRAEYLGHGLPPVIKWLPGPQAAFDYLSRHGLANLLQMENAALWRQSSCPEMDEEILDRWCVVRRLANDVLRPDDHDRALMAPKLAAKRNPAADQDAAFEARVFAAQIGWLETSIPDATVEALCRVEVLLSEGLSEASELVHHQLGIIEAYQHGLLATWETPDEMVCVPRSAA
jgi:hypothetical protein